MVRTMLRRIDDPRGIWNEKFPRVKWKSPGRYPSFPRNGKLAPDEVITHIMKKKIIRMTNSLLIYFMKSVNS